MHLEWQRDGFTLVTDPARIDAAAVHAYLVRSYWAEHIPLETVRRSLEHSLCFAVHEGERLVAFSRVVTDHATVAYVGDVFVLEGWRGRGLSKWMMECMVAHPALQGLRRWILLTRDAHGLYQRVGFTPLVAPERWMERRTPRPYPPAAP